MNNLRVTVRIEKKDRTKIDNLIKLGRYKNLSQVMRTALQKFLQDFGGNHQDASK